MTSNQGRIGENLATISVQFPAIYLDAHCLLFGD